MLHQILQKENFISNLHFLAPYKTYMGKMNGQVTKMFALNLLTHA